MEFMFQKILLLVIAVLAAADDYYEDDDYKDASQELKFETCDSKTNCFLPNCSCFGTVPLDGDIRRLPQFVMVTFDDAITTLNIKTYRKLADGKKNSNGCPVSMTFFSTHEYNDYEFVNELYSKGHEIAVHSITHESSTEMWKHATVDRWRNEMVGMRSILAKYGLIPSSEILGHRAPFLQTAGDDTFRMLKDNGFAYDSSLPTRTHMDPPLWPYTLDFGYHQDCQIQPCPRSKMPGSYGIMDDNGYKGFVHYSTGKINSIPETVSKTTSAPFATTPRQGTFILQENFNAFSQQLPIFKPANYLQSRITHPVNTESISYKSQKDILLKKVKTAEKIKKAITPVYKFSVPTQRVNIIQPMYGPTTPTETGQMTVATTLPPTVSLVQQDSITALAEMYKSLRRVPKTTSVPRKISITASKSSEASEKSYDLKTDEDYYDSVPPFIDFERLSHSTDTDKSSL